MATAIGRLCDQSSVRQVHVDDMTLTYVVDGAMAMVPDEFFGSIPWSYWREHEDDLTADGLVPMSAGGHSSSVAPTAFSSTLDWAVSTAMTAA